jgi:pimeloyl-ACP methyl ester carboxylesterase
VTSVATPARVQLTTPDGHFGALELGDRGARAVVFLHGFPDHPPTAAAFLGELAGHGYRVLAPWLRGYAPSRRAGPYDLDTLAADALAAADAWLGTGARFDLVGHDWGAAITYAACAAAPARIGRAVTLALPHPLTFLRQLREPAQARRSWYIAMFQLPGAGFAAPRVIDRLWRTWSPGFTLPAAARAELHACLAESMPAPLGPYRAMLRPPSAALARARRAAREPIAVPTLQLHGADDGCILPPPHDDARRFSGAYAREVLPGAGHFMHLEAPAAIAARVADWLGDRPVDR